MLRQALLLSAVVLFANPVAAKERMDEPQAIAEIERLGGQVERDEEAPNEPVVAVRFTKSNSFSDADVATLRSFHSLSRLYLGKSKITDVGLAGIARLENLTELDLVHTAITDAGMKQLRALPNLALLSLSFTKLTDVGARRSAGSIRSLG